MKIIFQLLGWSHFHFGVFGILSILHLTFNMCTSCVRWSSYQTFTLEVVQRRTEQINTYQWDNHLEATPTPGTSLGNAQENMGSKLSKQKLVICLTGKPNGWRIFRCQLDTEPIAPIAQHLGMPGSNCSSKLQVLDEVVRNGGFAPRLSVGPM